MRNTAAARARTARPKTPAFTLIETMIVILIIGIMVSLAFVVLGKVVKSSRDAAQRQALISLRFGVEQFKQQFGFLPPLVQDRGAGAPVNTGTFTPVVRDAAFLRYDPGTSPTEQRYSIYSLPYYLMGVLDAKVDGLEGPGFTKPNADGSFSRRNKPYEPLFDISRTPDRLVRDPASPYLVTLNDRWRNPIRYYRWLPRYVAGGASQGLVQNYNVPLEIRDPAGSAQLKDSEFAVVSVGADGDIDGSSYTGRANRDNIVEIGR